MYQFGSAGGPFFGILPLASSLLLPVFLYETQFLNFPFNGMFALHWLEAGSILRVLF